jgi:hypothetical protein
VIIARLGDAVGFEIESIVEARELQPRNVRDASMRESLVVLKKPRG